jgi:hypothetical protein
MRMPWRHRDPVPPDIVAVIRAAAGSELRERTLAVALVSSDTAVVAGRHRLWLLVRDAELPDGWRVELSRPWHLVDAGTWTGADLALRVTWVDDAPPLRLVLPEPGALPETLRERVQASVVLAETIDLGGPGTARVVVRRDLATGELLSQTVLGRGVNHGDADVAERIAAGLARVREQVGLD